MCGRDLPLEDFGKRNDRINCTHTYCKSCRKQRMVNSVLANRMVKTEWVRNYKSSKGCIICGFNEPVSLDLHHIDPNKKDLNVAQMVANNASLDKVKREIEKCIVICSNHHRMLHVGLITIPE